MNDYLKQPSRHQASVPAKSSKLPLIAIAIGLLLVGGFGATQYLKSDKYVNGKVLSQAEAAATAGEVATAMDLYGTLYTDSEAYKYKAVAGIRNLVRVDKLENTSNADFASVLDRLNGFSTSPLRELPDGVYQLALSRIKANKSSDPTSDQKDVYQLLQAAKELNENGEDLSAVNFSLAQTINKSDPTYLDAAVELSEHYFAKEDLAATKAVLAPVKDRLADTEAAKILGQIYIAEGNNKAAYPLLSAYTGARLKILQAAEQKFTQLQEDLWNKEYDLLNAGSAPQSFYNAYDSKSDDEKQLYVDEYISNKINNNTEYNDSLEAYREAAAIVPVVMDFGIVQLGAAETMTSEAERNAELKAAEKTFLSIKNIVGDTDEYKIYLGQVYFWLGKQSEGQALFDEVLAANNRSANSLLSIAGTLRTLGKVGMASALSQEAYDNSKDDETRYMAANLMHLLSDKIEDRITWLERSDPKSGFVKASLNESLGHLEMGKGNAKAAAKYYRRSIKSSESIGDSAGNFNNTALTYFSLHRATGDKDAYRKGVELMSKAVELRPDESILLSNAASTLVINALYETVGDNIDYLALQSAPSLPYIDYYYSNAAQRHTLRESLRPHKDMQKAIEYLKRSILLSPNSAQNYDALYAIYYFLDDRDAVAELADKMANNQIDISATNKKFTDFAIGADAEEKMEKLKDGQKFYLELLSDKSLTKQTIGVVHNSLAESFVTRVELGDTTVADQAVDHGQKAVKYLPSSASQANLVAALMTRASVQAADKFPAYKAMRTNSVKNLSDNFLVTLAISRDNEVANWLKSNADVKQAIALEVEEYKNFPDYTSPRMWALFKASNDGQTEKLASSIRGSEYRQSMQRINEITRPLSGKTISYRHWLNQVNGKPVIDKAKLDTLAQQGIILPAELFQ